MNNKYITIIAVVVVVLGGWFLLSGDSSAPTNTQDAPQVSDERSGSSSLQDLLSLGGNRYCTVAIEDQNFSATGEVFVAEDQIRVDFVSGVADQIVASSMIQTEGMIYTWTNMFGQGFKFLVSDIEAGAPGPDLSVGVTYDCEPWGEIDQSKFTLPEGIEFVAPE